MSKAKKSNQVQRSPEANDLRQDIVGFLKRERTFIRVYVSQRLDVTFVGAPKHLGAKLDMVEKYAMDSGARSVKFVD